MADLADELREVLLRHGASPATADELTADHAPTLETRLARDKRDDDAQRLLPLGPVIAAQRLGVCRSAIYKMAKRSRLRKRVQA